MTMGTIDVQEPASPNQLAQEPAHATNQVAAPITHGSQDPPLSKYSLDFLRPLSGSCGVQLDTALSESLAKFRLDDKLRSTKLGISGITDL